MNVLLAGAGHKLRKLLAWLRAQLPRLRFRNALGKLIDALRVGGTRIPLAA